MDKADTPQIRREALLKELSALHRIVCGSLFVRDLNGRPRWTLSQMINGKQRQVYVAQRHTDAVTEGVREYRRALEILSELGRINMTLIKQETDHE